MSGFIQGEDRSQATLFPERLDDYVAEDSEVRVIDVFLDELDLSGLGFKTEPNDTGRPTTHRRCSNSRCTVISSKCTQVVAWSGRLSATWS